MNIAMKKKIVNTLLLTTAIGLAACGDNRPAEEIVSERALARWEARKSGNNEALYDYLSPAKRQIVEKKTYTRQFGNAITYTDIKLGEVTCDTSEEAVTKICTVNLDIYYTTNDKQPVTGGTSLIETWLYEADQWWIEDQ